MPENQLLECLQFIKSFKGITGRNVPDQLKKYFLTNEYEKLEGKNILDRFSTIIKNNNLKYSALVIETNFTEMVRLSGWLNDDAYFDDAHIYIPIFKVKDKPHTCLVMQADVPGSHVFLFDEEKWFIDLGITLDGFLAHNSLSNLVQFINKAK